jgi:hypothetical protein
VANATRSLTVSQAPSVRSCGPTPTSAAMLRYMRVLGRAHRVDVGPACCGRHSLEWVRMVREREVVPW